MTSDEASSASVRPGGRRRQALPGPAHTREPVLRVVR